MGKSTAYLVSDMAEWIAVAQKIQATHGLEPKFWLTSPKTAEQVRLAFPDAHTLDTFLAARGLMDSDDAQFEAPLDAATQATHAWDESQLMGIMDRFDHEGRLTFRHRQQLSRRMLAHAIHLVDELDIEQLICNETPHDPFGFAFFRVCKARRIPMVMAVTTSIRGRILIDDDLDGTQPLLEAAMAAPLRNSLPPDVAEHVAAVTGDYRAGEPWYMRRQRATEATQGLIGHVARHVRKPWTWPATAKTLIQQRLGPQTPLANWVHLPPLPMDQSFATEAQVRRAVRRGNHAKLRLRRAHDEVAQAGIPDAPFVYLALQYQPERTTLPEAGFFEDQERMVRLLAASLPTGWRLLVREHPSQFTPTMHGQLGRSPDWYQRIASIPSVQLAALDQDSFKLIDCSRAVATATGTPGWEALLRGKPALVFGAAWYRRCPGAHRIRTTQDAQSALASIANGSRPDAQAVQAFLHAVASSSCKAHLNPSTRASTGTESTQNAEALFALFDQGIAVAENDTV